MGISDDKSPISKGIGAGGSLPRPNELRQELDRHVFGQDDAKDALSLAAYLHYFGLGADEDGKAPVFGRQHVLLLGPTGSGKSHLVRTLAKVLDVPVAICSATTLVEAGYVGEQCDSLLRSLLSAADGDARRAERGIVFIDEFDKVRRVRSSGSRDVSGEGVQNALLTYLDGIQVNIGTRGETHLLDTTGILFLCAGAFVDLAEHVRAQQGGSGIGFGAPSTDETTSNSTHTEPLVDFGLIPEILGRFGTIQALDPLDVDALERILTEVEDSALTRRTDLLDAHGTKLRLTAPARRAVAERAFSLGTGARSLDRVMNEVLNPVLHRYFTVDRPVQEIVIGKGAVDGSGQARFVFGEKPKKKPLGAEIRERAFCHEPETDSGTIQSPGRSGAFTNTRGWPKKRIQRLLERIKREQLDWVSASHPAQLWWSRFEMSKRTELEIVVRTAEELRNRTATIEEFFRSCEKSQVENIQANLFYLDYWRLKSKEDAKKQEKKHADRDHQLEKLLGIIDDAEQGPDDRSENDAPPTTGELPLSPPEEPKEPDDDPEPDPPFDYDDVPF